MFKCLSLRIDVRLVIIISLDPLENKHQHSQREFSEVVKQILYFEIKPLKFHDGGGTQLMQARGNKTNTQVKLYSRWPFKKKSPF